MHINHFALYLTTANVISISAAVVVVTKTITIDACATSVYSILSTVPTPTGDLVDYVQMAYSKMEQKATSKDEVSMFCHLTDYVPATMLSDWNLYTNAAHSWYAEKSPSLVSIATACLEYNKDKAAATVEALLTGLGPSDCPSPTATSISTSTPDLLKGITAGGGSSTTVPTTIPTMNMVKSLVVPLMGTESSSQTQIGFTALNMGPLETSAAQSSQQHGIVLISASVSEAAAAPRETGLRVGGFAAAGLLGAAVLL